MYLLGKWRHATFPLVQAKMYSNIKANIVICIPTYFYRAILESFSYKCVRNQIGYYTGNGINPIVFYY